MSAGAHDLTYDVAYDASRNRVTTLFRIILAVPHAICLGLWAYVVNLVAFLQWFVILFTGQRNEGMWRFQRSYLSYAARVNGYSYLLFDEYPGFFNDWKSEPVAFDLRADAAPNRLTNALRVIWIIPAAIAALFIGIGLAVASLVAWFAILVTGSMPRSLFDFILRATRLTLRLTAYGMLTTDDYPWYDGSEPTSVVPPGDRSLSGGHVPGYAGQGAPLPPPAAPPYP